jgi:hypothetical protein
MKIAINGCYGGFHLSLAALYWLATNSESFLEDCTPIAGWFQGEKQIHKVIAHPDLKDLWVYVGRWDNETYVYQDKVLSPYHYRDDHRNDPDLIRCIETLGDAACSGGHSKIKLVEIPDDVDWVIEEYDGMEWVAEKHRCWS